MTPEIEICSCCKGTKDNVPRMIKFSEDQYLCNICTSEIHRLFESLPSSTDDTDNTEKKLYPKDIKTFLDEYVIGQDDAKKVLAVEIYNHHKRITNPEKEIQKSNILMIGNSGSGKTLLVQTLAKLLKLPLAICDATNVTEAGYVGNDIETILQQLVVSANGDIKAAEKGIIFIDEIDKLAKQNMTSGNKDPSGLGVQQGLLKMIEGATVPIKAEPKGSKDYINTSNILFIGAGAFYGLDKLVEAKRKGKTTSIGFSASVEVSKNDSTETKEEDLIEYGFLPEFISRLPIIVQLQPLTKDDYKKILTEPKNNVIKQYQNLMSLDGIELTFTEKCIDEIVDEVYNSKRGARALRGSVEKAMRHIIYNLDKDHDKKFTIDSLRI